jgi:hypothetical protein
MANMPTTPKMMMTTLMVVREHWDALGELAKAEGLTRSSKLRQIVAQTVRRAKKEAEAEARSGKRSAKK